MHGLSHARYKIGPSESRLMYIYFGPSQGIAVAEGEPDGKLLRYLLNLRFRNAAQTPHLPHIIACSNQE